MHINIEFKARCNDLHAIRAFLSGQGADYRGRDHQVDVYFKVPEGRLKLRKGTIESSLVGYNREDHLGDKQSNVWLFPVDPRLRDSLEEVLTSSLGVKVVVDKLRDIYFIDNVKFHLDEVDGLGRFVEVEAIDKDSTIGRPKLVEQCAHYRDLLGVKDSDLVAKSYSDLLLAQS